MFNSVAIISPQITIHRMRLLPEKGKVNVCEGQSIRSKDVIAESKKSSRHILIDVGRGLGINKEHASRLLLCKIGEDIKKGDLIAGPWGRTHRVVRAPYSGKVVYIEKSEILLEIVWETFPLLAGYTGEVEKLFPGYGAMIKAQGSLIQGVWGNGKVSDGILSYQNSSNARMDLKIKPREEMKDIVLFMDMCDDAEIIQLAEQHKLKGLIFSSLKSEFLPLAKAVSFPVIVIDGLNGPGFNPVAQAILAKEIGKPVSINAQSWDRRSGFRPEVFIPRPDLDSHQFEQISKTQENRSFQVRVVNGQYSGKTGLLIKQIGLHRFMNGVRAVAAEVLFDGQHLEVFPISNLEWINTGDA